MRPVEIRKKVNLTTYLALRDQTEWMSAIEAAKLVSQAYEARVGTWPWSWRPVAFALRRLVRLGLVEEREVAYSTRHRYREYRREYRFIGERDSPHNPFMPRALPVPPEAPRRAIRSAGFADLWQHRDVKRTTPCPAEPRSKS